MNYRQGIMAGMNPALTNRIMAGINPSPTDYEKQ